MPRRKGFSPRIECLERKSLMAAGALDLRFGTGGTTEIPAITSLPLNEFLYGETGSHRCILTQPDGRIVIAYSDRAYSSNMDVTVVRLLANGQLDPSFGMGGHAYVSFDTSGYGHDFLSAIALQPDGKIVGAGTSVYTTDFVGAPLDTDMFVFRLTAEGILDTSFGTGGKRNVAFDMGGNKQDRCGGLIVQPDGKIVLAGNVTPGDSTGNPGSDFAMARLLSDGSLDSSFGLLGGGTEVFPYSIQYMNGLEEKEITTIDTLTSVAIQADGKFVLVGTANPLTSGSSNAALIMRITTGGVEDSTFKSGTIDDTDSANDVLIQPDGRIVLTAGPGFTVLRLLPDGSPDRSFGDGGALDAGGRTSLTISDLPDSRNGYALQLALQADGRIIVAGATLIPAVAATAFWYARLNPDGIRDTRFDGDGSRPFQPGDPYNAAPTAVTIGADGKLLILAQAIRPESVDVVIVARHTLNDDAVAPQVVGVRAVKNRSKPTETDRFDIRFSEPVISGSPSLYRVVSAGKDGKFGTADDRSPRIVSWTYDASTNTMKIKLSYRVSTRVLTRVEIDPSRVEIRDGAENLLDGDRNGTPGGVYRVNAGLVPFLDGYKLVGKSSRARGLRLSFVEPLEDRTARTARYYAVTQSGKDGIFGTKDDVRVAIQKVTHKATKTGSQVQLNFRRAVDLLRYGAFRIVVTSGALRSKVGVFLDGDGDGFPGGKATL